MKYNIKLIKNSLQNVRDYILIILIVLLMNHFLVFFTYVPTGSMIPTMNIGERFIVTRIPYYYRTPQTGDIVIFEHEEEYLVKRVIGEPGDVIDIEDGYVLLNGEVLDEPYILEQGMTYRQTLDMPYTIPDKGYFVMGDNRIGSGDSRTFGVIEEKDIIAKGAFRIYPFNKIGLVK